MKPTSFKNFLFRLFFVLHAFILLVKLESSLAASCGSSQVSQKTKIECVIPERSIDPYPDARWVFSAIPRIHEFSRWAHLPCLQKEQLLCLNQTVCHQIRILKNISFRQSPTALLPKARIPHRSSDENDPLIA